MFATLLLRPLPVQQNATIDCPAYSTVANALPLLIFVIQA
jgi:hypothetical protein